MVDSKMVCDSAERTAGRGEAKLNTPAERQMKNGDVKNRIAPNRDLIVGMSKWSKDRSL